MNTLNFRLRAFMLIFLLIMLIGSLGFVFTEGLSFTDGLYFTIVTIATVGYGDIHPATQSGKLLVVVIIIGGVGSFLGLIANASEIVLSQREKSLRMQKLHMVMGLFFSELGTRLLSYFAEFDPNLGIIQGKLVVSDDWTEDEFKKVSQQLNAYTYRVELNRGKIENLKLLLQGKSQILLQLMESPYILEHETFTDLIRAVLHLREELHHRNDLSGLPDSDRMHLAGDVTRAYTLLSKQWIEYMRYLKDHYPYLFSLAMRTNPFDPTASVVVKEMPSQN